MISQVSEHKRNETTTENLEQSWATLLFTIMEVEHGYLEDQFVSEQTLISLFMIVRPPNGPNTSDGQKNITGSSLITRIITMFLVRKNIFQSCLLNIQHPQVKPYSTYLKTSYLDLAKPPPQNIVFGRTFLDEKNPISKLSLWPTGVKSPYIEINSSHL